MLTVEEEEVVEEMLDGGQEPVDCDESDLNAFSFFLVEGESREGAQVAAAVLFTDFLLVGVLEEEDEGEFEFEEGEMIATPPENPVVDEMDPRPVFELILGGEDETLCLGLTSATGLWLVLVEFISPKSC